MDFYGTHVSVLVSSRLMVVVHVPIPASDKKPICCGVALDDDVGGGKHDPLADQRCPAKSLFPRVKDGAHVGPLSKVGLTVFELLDVDVDAANMALATFWLIHCWERSRLGFKIWVFAAHT